MIKMNRDDSGKFCKTYSCNENSFNKINTNEIAYVLGFICADGSLNKNILNISQSGEVEKLILFYIKDVLNSNHPLRVVKFGNKNHRDSYQLNIFSKKIIEDLNSYGIGNNKKYSLSSIKNLPEKYNKSFVRGYFDGDGCVGVYDEKKIKNGKTYVSNYLKLSFFGTKDFICWVNDNIIPEEFKGRIVIKYKHAEIIWTNKKAREFGEWLFSDEILYQSPKYQKYWEYMDEYKNKTPLNLRASKAVKQFDMDGNLINEYASLSDVKRILGLKISPNLKGITKQCGGYKWEYSKPFRDGYEN